MQITLAFNKLTLMCWITLQDAAVNIIFQQTQVQILAITSTMLLQLSRFSSVGPKGLQHFLEIAL